MAKKEQARLKVGLDTSKLPAELEASIKMLERSFRATITVVLDHSAVAKEWQKLNKELRDQQAKLPVSAAPISAAPKNSPPVAMGGLDKAWLARTRAEFTKALRNIDASISVSADGDALRSQLEAQIESLEDSLKLSIPVDPEAARTFRRDVERQIAELNSRHSSLTVNIDADTDSAQRSTDELIDNINGSEATVDVDASTLGASAHLQSFTRRPRRAVIEAVVDNSSLMRVGTALAAITGARSVTNMLKPMATALQNLDKSAPKLAGIGAGITTIGGAALASASNLLSLGASLSSVIGLAGLAPAVLGAAGAGIATMLTAFSGMGGALSALSKAKEDATKPVDAGKAESSAIQQRQAQEALEQAYISAADSKTRASKDIAKAEKSEGKSKADLTKVQGGLNDAYDAARKKLSDLSSQLNQASLDERKSATDMQDSIDAYNQAASDPEASDGTKKALKLQRDQAIQTYNDSKKKVKELSAESATAAKKGVEGSDEVTEAKQRITDAEDAYKDAQEATQQARADATKSELDSARQIQAAKDSIRLQELQLQSEQGKTAKAADEALAKLTPNARAVALIIGGWSDQLSGIRDLVQDNFFAGMDDPLRAMGDTLLPALEAGMGELSTSMGNGAKDFITALTDSLGGGVLEEMFHNTALATDEANKAIQPLTQAMMDIGLVGSSFLPQLAAGWADVSKQFGDFIGQAAADGSMAEFIQGGINAAKELGGILGSVFDILGSISGAASAAGGSTLASFGDMLERIADIVGNEPFKSALTTIFEGANDLISGLGDALGPIGQMFVDLAPTLKDIMGTVGETLAVALTAIAETLGDPAMQEGLKALFDGLLIGIEAIAPVLPIVGEALGSILKLAGKLLEAIGPVLGILLEAVAPIIEQLADLLLPVIEALMPVIQALAEVIGVVLGNAMTILTPILEFVVGLLEAFMPVLTDIVEFISAIMVGDIDGAFASIESLVDNLYKMFKTYLTELIPKLIGGLLDAFLTMPDKIFGGLDGVGDAVQSFFADIGNWLFNSGKSLIQGFIDGILSMVNVIGDAVGGVMDWVGGFFPNSPAKRGPFSGTGWTPHRGKALGVGFAEGISQSKIDVSKASLGLVNAVDLPDSIGADIQAQLVGVNANISAGSGGLNERPIVVNDSGSPRQTAIEIQRLAKRGS